MFISNNVKGQNIEENLGSWWMYFGTHKFSEKTGYITKLN